MASVEEKNPVQIGFFEKLKLSLPSNLSMANEVADLLEISVDGVYRRIRGETILSMDEMMKICNHFRISPGVAGSTSANELLSATFNYRNIISDENGFEDYLKNIRSDLKRIQAAKPNQIIYAAEDIPVFHQFYFPILSAFKIFFWQKAVLYIPSHESKKFDPGAIKPEMFEVCKQIIELYVGIPSIEIWHDDTVVSQIEMIEYAWESGMFIDKKAALHVCEALVDSLLLIEKQAAKSSKFIKEEKWAENEGNFTVYQSDVQIGNNHLLIKSGNIRSVYLSLHSFNSMSTLDDHFCDETDKWLKNMIRKSSLISGVGEKQRHKFFRNSQEKIASLVSRISTQ